MTQLMYRTRRRPVASAAGLLLVAVLYCVNGVALDALGVL